MSKISSNTSSLRAMDHWPMAAEVVTAMWTSWFHAARTKITTGTMMVNLMQTWKLPHHLAIKHSLQANWAGVFAVKRAVVHTASLPDCLEGMRFTNCPPICQLCFKSSCI
mmetsp:Transcript_90759/g.174740  ORF Transcript_90759/g.174740 Transcript_90759/m.174740 type:complete len:110 (+) Transcript_90759:137-466(+)